MFHNDKSTEALANTRQARLYLCLNCTNIQQHAGLTRYKMGCSLT